MRDLETDAPRAYDLLRHGGLALACTDTGYGFIAMRSPAVRRIYELKGRSSEKPCVTVGTLPILDDVALDVSPHTRHWLETATTRWPLAVIAHSNPRSRLLARMEPFVVEQSQKAGTIATFYGVGPLIQRVAALAYADGELVVGSSANLSGTGNNYRLDEVPPSILDAVDLVVEGTPRFQSPERLASTILDLTTGRFHRRGVGFAEVEASWLEQTRGHAPLAQTDGPGGAVV
jgi:tRNA A37 threonylcarbamoyladenosine synthetase subunit TsaC/SUA5/YrdC